MKNALVLVILVITFSATRAQTPNFAKYDIGSTDCEIYMPADPEFELSYSEDSAEVWTGEAENSGLRYAAICVKFKEAIGEDEEESTELLTSYLAYLQTQFEVADIDDYSKGQSLGERTDVYGLFEYWKDADSLQYAVMGWINKDYLAVLMIYGKEDPNISASNMFFQGMRFPEEE